MSEVDTNSKNIRVGISARHVHLSQEHVNILFGENYNLTKFKDLYQTGEYASNEKVTVSTKDGKIANVRILGPVRPESQVELSKSDTRSLKVNPPVRNSGDLQDSAAVTLEGPNGTVELKQGCIIATRHIHLSLEDADNFGIKNNEVVAVRVRGEKGGVMHNVYCKVKDSYMLEMHIDVDDANAFLISNEDVVEIVKNVAF